MQERVKRHIYRDQGDDWEDVSWADGGSQGARHSDEKQGRDKTDIDPRRLSETHRGCCRVNLRRKSQKGLWPFGQEQRSCQINRRLSCWVEEAVRCAVQVELRGDHIAQERWENLQGRVRKFLPGAKPLEDRRLAFDWSVGPWDRKRTPLPEGNQGNVSSQYRVVGYSSRLLNHVAHGASEYHERYEKSQSHGRSAWAWHDL